jgi:hypothetical protein
MLDIGIRNAVPRRLKLMHLFDAGEIAALPGIEPDPQDFFSEVPVLDFADRRKKSQNVISILLLHLLSFAD